MLHGSVDAVLTSRSSIASKLPKPCRNSWPGPRLGLAFSCEAVLIDRGRLRAPAQSLGFRPCSEKRFCLRIEPFQLAAKAHDHG